MAEEKSFTVSLKQMEELVPGYRILSHRELWAIYRAMSVLWEQSSGLSEEFRQKLFSIQQHIYYYMVHNPGSYRRTATESLAHIRELLQIDD